MFGVGFPVFNNESGVRGILVLVVLHKYNVPMLYYINWVICQNHLRISYLFLWQIFTENDGTGPKLLIGPNNLTCNTWTSTVNTSSFLPLFPITPWKHEYCAPGTGYWKQLVDAGFTDPIDTWLLRASRACRIMPRCTHPIDLQKGEMSWDYWDCLSRLDHLQTFTLKTYEISQTHKQCSNNCTCSFC